MAGAKAKRMERGGEAERACIHLSSKQIFLFYSLPSVLSPPSLPSLSALKRAVKLVPSDAPAQWPTTTTAAAASARRKNRQSPGHARAREVERNVDRQGGVVGRAHHLQLANVLGRAFELGQRLLFKHCIVIAYAVSCCLLPMQTPYYL